MLQTSSGSFNIINNFDAQRCSAKAHEHSKECDAQASFSYAQRGNGMHMRSQHHTLVRTSCSCSDAGVEFNLRGSSIVPIGKRDRCQRSHQCNTQAVACYSLVLHIVRCSLQCTSVAALVTVMNHIHPLAFGPRVGGGCFIAPRLPPARPGEEKNRGAKTNTLSISTAAVQMRVFLFCPVGAGDRLAAVKQRLY